MIAQFFNIYNQKISIFLLLSNISPHLFLIKNIEQKQWQITGRIIQKIDNAYSSNIENYR